MKNHSDRIPEVYKKPERNLEIDGPALPRWSPPDSWALPDDHEHKTRPVLIPVDVEGREAIGKTYRYVVHCRTDIDIPSYPDLITLDLDSIVGTEVTLSIDVPGKGEFIPGMPGDSGRGNRGFHIRRISGCVTKARFVRRDDRAMVYQFVIEPALALAKKGRNYRIFQDCTIVEVLQSILARYPMGVDWKAQGPLLIDHYPQRDLIRQHFESDFTFFQRQCEANGLFWWFRHEKGTHAIVVADSLGSFRSHGEAYETLRYSTDNRFDEEHIDRLEVASMQTEGSVTTVDHDQTQPRMSRVNTPLRGNDAHPRDTANADQEYYTYANVSQPLQGAMGLNAHPNDVDAEARFAALVRMQSLRCNGLRAKGHGNMRGLLPAHTFNLTEYPVAKFNQVWLVVSAKLKIRDTGQASGTAQEFTCETNFVVQPVREYFRLPFKTEWPTVQPERAIVTGPEGQEIWTDAHGRIRCQLVPDRKGKYDQNSFIWIYPLQPSQNRQMGTTAVPRIGSEIIIGYVNGNPDMPFVYGSVVNATNMPAWELPRNQWLVGMRSRMEGGSSSNHLALDDTNGQQQAQLASDHGKSSLSVGFNTRIDGNDGRQDARGEGFEVRTDFWGVLRAAKGLVLTTFGRLNARGKVKDMTETHAQLTQARGLHEDSAHRAQQHGAQDDTGNQRDVSDAIKEANAAVRGQASSGPDSFPELQKPDITISSAANVHVAATDSAHIMAGDHVAMTAGGNVSIAGAKSFFASVLGMVSLFAQQAGIRLIAGKGKVEMQAQNDEMALQSFKDFAVTSTNGKVVITAAKEIWIGAGGSYIQITASGITNGTPGTILEKGATWSKQGADSQRQVLPGPIGNTPDFLEISHQYDDIAAVKGTPYKVTLGDGSIVTGKLDANGYARLEGVPPGTATGELLEDAREWSATPKQANRYTGSASDEQAAIDLVKSLRG